MKNIFVLCTFLSIVAADNPQQMEEIIELGRMEHFFLVGALNGEQNLRLHDYQDLLAHSAVYIPQELLFTKDEAIYFLYEYIAEEHPSLTEAEAHDLINGVIEKVYVGSIYVMIHTRLLRLLHKEIMARAQQNVAAIAAVFEDDESLQPIYDVTGNGCLVYESSFEDILKYDIKKCPLTREPLLEQPLLVENLIEYLLVLKKKRQKDAEALLLDDVIARDVISLRSFIVQHDTVKRLEELLEPVVDKTIFAQRVVASQAKTIGFINLEKLIQSLQQEE